MGLTVLYSFLGARGYDSKQPRPRLVSAIKSLELRPNLFSGDSSPTSLLLTLVFVVRVMTPLFIDSA